MIQKAIVGLRNPPQTVSTITAATQRWQKRLEAVGSTRAEKGANLSSQVSGIVKEGLISKHAILIIEFANDLQRSGVAKREAIEQAAGIRLRPILMTTAAMVLGVVPLILASGAGAVSRFNLGLVIASGLSIGTLFTLFVVPAVYLLIATDHSRRAERGASQVPAVSDAVRRI